MDDFSTFIDHWLQQPTTGGFERFDPQEALPILDQRITDAWEHGRDAERRSLLELRQALLDHQEQRRQSEENRLAHEPPQMTGAGIPLFLSLSQALIYISERLERGDADTLLAACAHERHPAGDVPASGKPLSSRAVPSPAGIPPPAGFPYTLPGAGFPTDMDCFTLGGHLGEELGCIAIEFTQVAARLGAGGVICPYR